jgi:[ribosomal protein S18]-alanine N-acetyltransferase
MMQPPADDIDRIMDVMERAFESDYGEAWTRRQVEDALLVGNCHYLLVDTSGGEAAAGAPAAGFSLSRAGFEEEELLLFAVVPDCRRRGIGLRMLQRLTEAARARGAGRLLLEMRRGNPAESLYHAFGFRQIGERRNYYRAKNGDRIDAITLACAIE